MTTAGILYSRNVEEAQRGVGPKSQGYPCMNELNVARACTGYAFELILKVLVRARGERPLGKHEPSKIYGRLNEEDRSEVRRILARHGWDRPGELLKLLDGYSDPNSKYWGESLDENEKEISATFHFGGRVGMDALQRLHAELSEFALRRIREQPGISEDKRVHEIWPGV